jgi:hypothetical protein
MLTQVQSVWASLRASQHAVLGQQSLLAPCARVSRHGALLVCAIFPDLQEARPSPFCLANIFTDQQNLTRYFRTLWVARHRDPPSRYSVVVLVASGLEASLRVPPRPQE